MNPYPTLVGYVFIALALHIGLAYYTDVIHRHPSRSQRHACAAWLASQVLEQDTVF